MSGHVLAIDQGTTSTRAVVYDAAGQSVGSAAQEIKQYYPQPGWVEHDAEEIWQSVAGVVPQALAAAGVQGRDLAAIGLTNQRETLMSISVIHGSFSLKSRKIFSNFGMMKIMMKVKMATATPMTTQG